MKINPGQILPSSKFGKLLTQLAREAGSIVEIGTWFGEGSTRCLANGLVRPDQRMWTIEINKERHEDAKSRYNDERITFLLGSTRDVLQDLPSEIDLLLIDGGEDQGWDDYQLLGYRAKIIALDDTLDRCQKGKVSRIDLLKKNWTVIADNREERNGFFIARRPQS